MKNEHKKTPQTGRSSETFLAKFKGALLNQSIRVSLVKIVDFVENLFN